MSDRVRSTVIAYLVAIGATAAGILLRWLMDPWLADRLPFITFFGAVAAAVWYGGYPLVTTPKLDIPLVLPRFSRPQEKKRQPMTVCAAAICTVNRTVGGADYAVLGISDRMMTYNEEIEYEPVNHTKIFALAPAKAIILGAGDSSINFVVNTATHRELISSNTVSVEERVNPIPS